MSVYQAKKGESKDCPVLQEVLALYWTRRRVHPGDTVALGAIVKDVKDGQKVTFEIVSGTEPIAKVEGTLEGGRVQAEWKVQLPPRDDWPEEVPLAFDVVVGTKLRSAPQRRVVLEVDAGLPPFSL